ncbi:MAG: hypothetical protein IPG79_17080 [Saprospiraceae bacterium]|nr:hypothetical protein [Saprospiraceae bacterium]
MPVTVNITSSTSLGSGENVFVRYSTNGFTTSNIVQATFSATAGTAIIPGQLTGITVSYYIFQATAHWLNWLPLWAHRNR